MVCIEFVFDCIVLVCCIVFVLCIDLYCHSSVLTQQSLYLQGFRIPDMVWHWFGTCLHAGLDDKEMVCMPVCGLRELVWMRDVHMTN